jgi:anti-sigma regulatory factor (Ser/Thr protein kinase)
MPNEQPRPSTPSEQPRDLQQMTEQLERQALLLARDEQVARELQHNLQPVLDADMDGLNVAVHTHPGTRVGGDFYDVIDLGDKYIAFLIADVSGYGLPAAVIMATGRLAFRTSVVGERSPRAIMDRVNRAMLHSTLAGHYLTAFLGVLDTEMLTLQYVNASHCAPLLLRAGETLPLDTDGLFVGMFETPQYEEKGIQLERDDRILLYTDGLLRAFDAKDRPALVTCLADYVQGCADQSLDEMIARLDALDSAPEDDVAVMGIELLHEKAKEKVVVISSIPSHLSYVENAILPVLANKGYGERALFAIKLAVEEGVINAIKHGNQLDDTKKVTVTFRVEDDRARISILDEGEGFELQEVPDPTSWENLTATSGRGLALIEAYMDEVYHEDDGRCLAMVKYAPWCTESSK